jgi:hypothetical protein
MERETSKKRNNYSWKITDDDLKNQVENYDTLKITQSYRGQSVLFFSTLLAISTIGSFFVEYISTEEMVGTLIIYVPILIFSYRGHRWAIIAFMILWTIDKVAQFINGESSFLIAILWMLIMPLFYKALKVENERRKLAKVAIVQKPANAKHFCQHCGSALESDALFCTNCGKSI